MQNEMMQQLQQSFIKTMREKHSTIEGRSETLDVLVKECSYSIMKEIKTSGGTEIPENFKNLVKERMRKELENVLSNM